MSVDSKNPKTGRQTSNSWLQWNTPEVPEVLLTSDGRNETMSTGTRTWFIKHLEKEGSRAMPKNSNTPRFQMEAHIGEDNRNSNNSWHFLSTDSVPHPVLVAYHQRDSLIFTPTYEWGTIKSHILFKWGKPHRDSVPLGIQIQVVWLWDPMLQPTSASRDGDCNHCVYETPGIVRAP